MSTPSYSPTRRELLALSAAAGAASLLPASAGAATGGDSALIGIACDDACSEPDP